MHSAYDLNGNPIDAEELMTMDSVDQNGFKCICGSPVVPCSFLPKNKIRPHFRAEKGHNHDCDEVGLEEKKARARTERVLTKKGEEIGYPNKLVRPSSLQKDSDDQAGMKKGTFHEKKRQGMKPKNRGKSCWDVSSIRSFCRYFMTYPHDRDHLNLTIPGIDGRTYSGAFMALDKNRIKNYETKRIYYSEISWYNIEYNKEQEHIDIKLHSGDRKLYKVERPYIARVHCEGLSERVCKAVIKEIEITKGESKAAKNDAGAKGWVFFIGEQDKDDLALWHIYDRRDICSLFGAITYPFMNKKTGRH